MCNDVSMDDPQEEQDLIETPVNLRPDLTEYGIEEYDIGICEDNYRNRTILRKAKLSWHPIFDREGNATGRIEVMSMEMQTNQALDGIENRRSILQDPKNKNSDYLSGLDLLYANGVENLVAPWVLHATRDYDDILDRRDENPDKKIRPALVDFPRRCRYVKSNGVRCLLWTAGRQSDDGLCRTHLGSKNADAGAGAVNRARQRIMQAAPYAVDIMEEMAMHATSEIVRQRAAEQILDRAGVRGGIEVEHKGEIEIKPAKDMLAERLKSLAENTIAQQELEKDLQRALNAGKPTEDIEDAVIVEDEIPVERDTENDNG